MRRLRGRVLAPCGRRSTEAAGRGPTERAMTGRRNVCPWGCSGRLGEVDVVGAERARVPGLAASTALVRCAECQRISIAGMTTTVSSNRHGPRTAELRTALGRFEGDAWVPAAIHLLPLILQFKIGKASARRRRSS